MTTFKLVSGKPKDFIKSDAGNDAFLESSNKIGRLYARSDGNLVLSEKKYNSLDWDNSYKIDIWSRPSTSNTYTPPFTLLMQKDGNLVYLDNNAAVVWSTNTAGKGSEPFTFQLNDDGELVLLDSINTVQWRSRSMFTFWLVDDSRLVAYFNPGILASYNSSSSSDNSIITNIATNNPNGNAKINAPFSPQNNSAIRLQNTNSLVVDNTGGLSIPSILWKTISFWIYVHDIPTSERYLIDIPGIGYINSTINVSPGLQTAVCMIDGGALQALTLSFNNFEKKGVWTNITIILSQPKTTEIHLFSNMNQEIGMNCSFGAVLVYTDTLSQAENFTNYNYFKKKLLPLTAPIPLPFDVDRVKAFHPDDFYDLSTTYYTVQNRTPEDCRQLALKDPSKYAAWMFTNDLHPSTQSRNTCKLLLRNKLQETTKEFVTYTDQNNPILNIPSIQDNIYTTGCVTPGERLDWGCRTIAPNIDYKSGLSLTAIEEEAGYGTDNKWPQPPRHPDTCRINAFTNPKYKAWAYGTANNSDSSKRYKCFFYTDEIKPFETNYKVDDYISGCINPNEVLSLGCKVPPPPPPSSSRPSLFGGRFNTSTSTPDQENSSFIVDTSVTTLTGESKSSVTTSSVTNKREENSSAVKDDTDDNKKLMKIVKIAGFSLIGLLVFIIFIVLIVKITKGKKNSSAAYLTPGPMYNVQGLGELDPNKPLRRLIPFKTDNRINQK